MLIDVLQPQKQPLQTEAGVQWTQQNAVECSTEWLKQPMLQQSLLQQLKAPTMERHSVKHYLKSDSEHGLWNTLQDLAIRSKVQQSQFLETDSTTHYDNQLVSQHISFRGTFRSNLHCVQSLQHLQQDAQSLQSQHHGLHSHSSLGSKPCMKQKLDFQRMLFKSSLVQAD